MQFDILTIFPEMFASYLNESIIKRARKNKIIKINFHNIRDFATDKHKTVDDRPYGGGPGMVMKIEPLYRCLKSIKKKRQSKTYLLSAPGIFFNQQTAAKLSHLSQVTLICGRYEGVDARIKKYIDGEISVGPYVLTGGELPALTVIDAVTRLLPGVLGDNQSSKDESFTTSKKFKEHPHYTRPEKFNSQSVPKTLLSGNHSKIAAWRKKMSKS